MNIHPDTNDHTHEKIKHTQTIGLVKSHFIRSETDCSDENKNRGKQLSMKSLRTGGRSLSDRPSCCANNQTTDNPTAAVAAADNHANCHTRLADAASDKNRRRATQASAGATAERRPKCANRTIAAAVAVEDDARIVARRMLSLKPKKRSCDPSQQDQSCEIEKSDGKAKLSAQGERIFNREARK